MKAKLTITVDEALIPEAKLYARKHGVSLSQLIENSLRTLTSQAKPSFSERWGGQFEASEHDTERYRKLAKKYLS
jgi:hypothetical protein